MKKEKTKNTNFDIGMIFLFIVCFIPFVYWEGYVVSKFWNILFAPIINANTITIWESIIIVTFWETFFNHSIKNFPEDTSLGFVLLEKIIGWTVSIGIAHILLYTV